MTRKEEYQLYLKSPAWKAIRKLAINRDRSQCVKCGNKRHLTVHHVRYPERFGTEPLDYLQTLCEDCHNVLHGGTPRKGKKKKEVSQTVRKRKHRLKTDKQFAKTVRLSSPIRVFTQSEIAAYEGRL